MRNARMRRLKKLKPLVKFDFGLIQKRVDGVLINIDRDLQRRITVAGRANNHDLVRQLTLLNVMIRIASNSYTALCFLLSDLDKDYRRRPNFVLVAVPVNRQLMDLLFTLVYMLDDFGPRSLAYERAGWRAFKEEYNRYHSRFGGLREWRPFFADQKETLQLAAKAIGITTADKRRLERIARWKGPFKLAKEKTASQPFLQWLEKWLYGETSAQAHLTGTGLFSVSPFLLSDLASDDMRKLIEERAIHQYRGRYVSQ
jgi:hypothetical protein